MTTAKPGIISEVVAYLSQYVSFPSPDYAMAAALWAVGTHFWTHLDVFPYLVITSDTKRSGKSRLKELLSFVVSNPKNMSAMTPANVYRIIDSQKPTMFCDEAESLNGESANVLRVVLNVGYRRGETIPRMVGGESVDFSAYCPKCFVLIGDVYDTLRDRSIIVRMRRGEPATRFLHITASAQGQALRERLAECAADSAVEVMGAFAKSEGLSYLTDRDEELWLPLLTVASVLEPAFAKRIPRVAVDLSTEKTTQARRFSTLKGAEEKAEEEEYAVRLLRDLLVVVDGAKGIYTRDAVVKLYELETSPWRKYRGEGLTAIDLGNMLGGRFGVSPKTIRLGKVYKGKGQDTAKGYLKSDLVAALTKNNL